MKSIGFSDLVDFLPCTEAYEVSLLFKTLLVGSLLLLGACTRTNSVLPQWPPLGAKTVIVSGPVVLAELEREEKPYQVLQQALTMWEEKSQQTVKETGKGLRIYHLPWNINSSRAEEWDKFLEQDALNLETQQRMSLALHASERSVPIAELAVRLWAADPARPDLLWLEGFRYVGESERGAARWFRLPLGSEKRVTPEWVLNELEDLVEQPAPMIFSWNNPQTKTSFTATRNDCYTVTHNSKQASLTDEVCLEKDLGCINGTEQLHQEYQQMAQAFGLNWNPDYQSCMKLYAAMQGTTEVILESPDNLSSLRHLPHPEHLKNLQILPPLIGSGKLTGINLSPFSNLIRLSMRSQQLKELNLLHVAPQLSSLDVSQNPLEVLQLGQSLPLKELYAQGGKLTSLKLPKMNTLKRLNLSGNQLTKIDLSSHPHLERIQLSANRLTFWTQENFAQLTHLDLSHNRLSKVSLKEMPRLSYLKLSTNPLETLELEQLDVLPTLELGGMLSSNKLKRVTLRSLEQVHSISITYQPLESLILEGLPQLKSLILEHNMQSHLNLTNLPALATLTLQDNRLNHLTLKNLPSLKSVTLEGNDPSSTGLSMSIEGASNLKSIRLDPRTLTVETRNKLDQMFIVCQLKSGKPVLWSRSEQPCTKSINLRSLR